ncbi:MAG TPA: division/cell wall cluster transcriptional repressor MraZ [Ignavibacteria bacterium]|nr:division/cell wall cluster transcriptional repressor MraZ [Ignavibacteria bacterium]HQY51261.1 division/cell wall cluster transcriptional repressor MraZ [Ignavibacteria bacterium]HRA99931.1 division/cell wall cluster transcriptional repressor MraZ [Ignavibacteria bacterium]
MFIGHSVCNLDAKSRLILPAKFRKNINPEADNKLVLTKGMDGCVAVYPYDEWERENDRLASLNKFNIEDRYFLRDFMFNATECEIDSQNRILIPSSIIVIGGLKKEILLTGAMKFMEIWDPERKNIYDNSIQTPIEEIAERVTEKNISQQNKNSGDS